MATVQPQTTQLEFHQAMADFKTMFPAMDDDVIEAVLRSNQGAVDVTIDQLLAMSTDNENEKLRNEIDDLEPSAACPDVILHEKNTSRDMKVNKSETETIRNDASYLKSKKKWAPPLLGPLPDDFLRFNIVDKQTENELEDEKIALFLQNEEFLAELRWNKDFLSVLDKDSLSDGRASKFQPSRSSDEDAIFREKLRNMGKMSRKKFSQLARVFTGCKKKGSAKAILNKDPAPSNDNLLLHEEESDGA